MAPGAGAAGRSGPHCWHAVAVVIANGAHRAALCGANALPLQERGALDPASPPQRITFAEVTKSAILAALSSPRPISTPLVDAYMARRALDYLFGFSLSPLLWRKLPGARSAGRVQSVALRMVAGREAAILAFRPVQVKRPSSAIPFSGFENTCHYCAIQSGTSP